MTFDAPYVRRVLSRWDYDADAVAAYARAMEAAMRLPESAEVLERTAADYASGKSLNIKSVLAQMDGFAPVCGESPYTMRMLPYICMLDAAHHRYDEAGIGEDVYTGSFADLLWKTRECRRVYGIWGTFAAPWFYRFFELKCFALGRLQFEFTAFSADGPLVRGERVINVHIPSSGPLNHADCEESYDRAAGFFGFRGGDTVPFVCDSWMLHPLCAGLDEGSGIRRFAADYTLLRVIDDPDRSDVWRIFDVPWSGDASALPENTSLQRLFRRQLLSGGTIGRGYGLYLRKVQ